MYNAFLTLMQVQAPPTRMRVERLWTDTNWRVVWTNLWKPRHGVYEKIMVPTYYPIHLDTVSLNVAMGNGNGSGRDGVWQ